MSYARFGADGSDVYVFHSVHGYLECCMCLLQAVECVEDPEAPLGVWIKAVEPRIQTDFRSPEELEAHLAEHTAAGHHVPDYVMPGVRADWGRIG